MAAETADGSFFDCHQHFVFARKPPDEVHVERFGEAGIGDGGRQSGRIEFIRRLQAFAHASAEAEQRHLCALAPDNPLADFQDSRAPAVEADTFAARIAEAIGPSS
jgi:hypothetical protein